MSIVSAALAAAVLLVRHQTRTLGMSHPPSMHKHRRYQPPTLADSHGSTLAGTAHTLFTTFDKAHSGALQNILREASQPVPEELTRFGSTVKKKEHKMYGSFGPADGPMKQATRIVFD